MLERAGLISRGRDAQRRPCRIEAQALSQASAWLEDYRRLWEGNFQRLDALLRKPLCHVGRRLHRQEWSRRLMNAVANPIVARLGAAGLSALHEHDALRRMRR